ncbi:MAG: helix-turn-helix transcriptional regulator [Bryobacteraceae bacterium]|nr:helix-turn-helix transcriptional regulator [Bryobacteraceae bacterium]
MSRLASQKRAARPIELFLPSRRQAAGVSLQQIVESTKISTRFLEAIELERFHELPGGIFATNYIRQYSEAIRIDPGPVLELYHRRMDDDGRSETNNTPSNGGGSSGFRWVRFVTS